MSALVLAGLGVLILSVWQPILLVQLLLPPRVDAGYHNSEQWLERRAEWWQDHKNARCRVTFLRAETTIVILGFERGGLLGWKPVLMQRKTKKLHLHEWLYPPNRRWRTPDWALTPLTPTAHRRLHKFDRWLWRTVTLGLWTDKRNRLLPVSSFLYIYGRYAIPLAAVLIWVKLTH